jgi:hypothetical protein
MNRRALLSAPFVVAVAPLAVAAVPSISAARDNPETLAWIEDHYLRNLDFALRDYRGHYDQLSPRVAAALRKAYGWQSIAGSRLPTPEMPACPSPVREVSAVADAHEPEASHAGHPSAEECHAHGGCA